MVFCILCFFSLILAFPFLYIFLGPTSILIILAVTIFVLFRSIECGVHKKSVSEKYIEKINGNL